MAWTPMKTWAVGETVEASELNTYLRDNGDYLKGQADAGGSFYGVRVTRSTAQNIATGTYTDVSWDTETFDVGSWIAVTATTFTVPAAAVPSGMTNLILQVTCKARYANNATGVRFLRIIKDGATWGTTSTGAVNGDTTDMALTDFVTAVSGTTIKIQIAQSSGGNLDTDQLVCSIVRMPAVS